MLKYIGVLPLISLVALSQSVTLGLTSASAAPGSTVSLNLQINALTGSSPSALEWTVNAPSPDIQSITASAGPAASSASKSIQCVGKTCLLYGLNANPIPNGTVAVLSLQLSSTASGNLAIQLSNTSAASPLGGSLGLTTTNGVVSVLAPQLSITKTHVGTFMRGQQNAVYNVMVSNAANASSTSGTVTVVETVPSGMTLQSMSGAGWTCPGTASNNCTRNDALSGGASYQPITVTVNVAANATSPQVNSVAVSGGGSAAASTTDTTNITVGSLIGSEDLAGNASGVGTVVKGSSLYVFGWAADTATGAPVQSVTVFVDGNSEGTATLGGARSDVASAYGRSDFTNSGWSFQMSTGALTVGPHTVTATAAGTSGAAALSGSKTVNITAAQGQEIGFVDMAGNASGVGSVGKGQTLYVRGWAVDTASGAPVQSVTVFVDGNSVGTATLGSARSDVASAYGRSDYTNSGWSFQMSTSPLSVGPHTVTATAVGPSGTAPLVGSKTVNITTQGQEIGSVDLAGTASGVGTVTKGNTLFVFGWAADTASGAPVQSVTVFVDGGSAGTATLGLARSDVASAYGRSDFTNSGWSFQMSTNALSLGQHTVTATAVGPSGTAPLSGSKTVNIQ